MCAFQIRKRKKEKKVRDREKKCAIHRQWEKRKRREKARDDRKLCAYTFIKCYYIIVASIFQIFMII